MSSGLTYIPRADVFTVFSSSLEKLGSPIELSIFEKLSRSGERLEQSLIKTKGFEVYYTRKFGYFLSFTNFIPNITRISDSSLVNPSELKSLSFAKAESTDAAISCLSSSTFFWYWNVLSDCRNMNRRDVLAFPIDLRNSSAATVHSLTCLAQVYIDRLKSTARQMTKSGLYIETFEYSTCKSILDKVDQVLAEHYGLTDEELDFITNYDIKYRMGRDAADED
jgi:hypothetical protein